MRAAVQEANAVAGTDTITLGAATHVLTNGGSDEEAGATGDLDISDHLIIAGAGKDLTSIDGNGTDRVLDINNKVSVELRDLTIRNGYLPPDYGSDGGGIQVLSSGNLTVTRSRLTANTSFFGGAVSCGQSTRVFFTDSVVDANNATSTDGSGGFGAGGAVHASDCAVSIKNSQFTNNTGNSYGGALYVTGELFVSNSTFSGNRANDDGAGAIYLSYGSTGVIVGSLFTGNTSAQGSGAISSASPIFIADTTFSNNTAGFYCGAFSLQQAHLENVKSLANVSGATGSGGGGGGCLSDSTVENSIFKDNVVANSGYGGGLSITRVVVRNSAFINNQVLTNVPSSGATGGALVISGASSIENTTISGNVANDGGGVNLWDSSDVTFSNVTMTGNRSNKGTTANLFASSTSSSVTLANTIISNPANGVNCSGAVIASNRGNIASDMSCANLSVYDQINTDPLLGTLDTVDYVHPIGSNSPAVDKGLATECPNSDQRGYLRSGICDAGAYELGATQPAVSTIGISESFIKTQEIGTVTFTLTRTGSSEGEVRAVVATEPGTALTNAFTTVATVVTWADGDTAPKTVSITIAADTRVEDGDEFTFHLVAVSRNATIDPAHQQGQVRIIDNDGAYGDLRLDSYAYSKWEHRGQLTAYVQRVNGSDKDVSVEYRIVGGTAVDGADYTGSSGILEWGPNDAAPKAITIPILNDAVLEGEEDFVIELFNISRAGFNGASSATATILDDESTPVFDFSSAAYTVAENAKNAVVTVTRTGRLDVPASVYVWTTASGDTAINTKDYWAIYPNLVFAAGETVKTASIPLIDDAVVESAERFTIRLTGLQAGH